MTSIAACYNVYNDAKALRGSLEMSAQFFDEIFIVHSGPGGAYSTDGTIELCEAFGARMVFDDIDRGFGDIRTRLVHECNCSWAFIMDADERFYPMFPILECNGTEKFPEVASPALTVNRRQELVYPGQTLRSTIASTSTDAIRTIRRHWFDFTFTRPAENWEIRKDYQLRIVRNHKSIRYSSDIRMHEQLIDMRSGETPNFTSASEIGGPFHDHFHLAFRKEFPGSKEFNERNYARLVAGEKTITQ